MKVETSFEEMAEDQRAKLKTDSLTGLQIVARAVSGGVEWLSLSDGSEVVRCRHTGKPAEWPE